MRGTILENAIPGKTLLDLIFVIVFLFFQIIYTYGLACLVYKVFEKKR